MNITDVYEMIDEAFEMTLDPDITTLSAMVEYLQDHYTPEELEEATKITGFADIYGLIMSRMDYNHEGERKQKP